MCTTVNKIIAGLYDESQVEAVISQVVGIDVLIVHAELFITDSAGMHFQRERGQKHILLNKSYHLFSLTPSGTG